MRTRRPIILVAVLALGALVPASASAQLPAPKSTAVVPGKSIAGVSIGMSIKRALAVWGPGSRCTEASVSISCDWVGTDRQGAASFVVGPTGKVRNVSFSTGRKGNDLIYAGPLQRWRTSRKVRLGTASYKVVKAYPKIKGAPSGLQLGGGNRATIFMTSSNRIYQIYLGPAL